MIVAIPTSNRPEMLSHVIDRLQGFEQIYIYVNNCDMDRYAAVFEKAKHVRVIDLTDIQGEPKQCHNLTFRKMIETLPEGNDVLFLEDDLLIGNDFYEKFTRNFRYLKSFFKDFSISPIWIPSKKCHYTPQTLAEIILRNNGIENHLQRYVDGNFAVTSGVLSGYKMLIKEKDFPVLKSTSGIGPVLSRYMYEHGYPMMVTKPSLVGHGTHESLQFGIRRKMVPLIATIGR